MYRKYALLFASVLALASCGQEPISIEEKILMRSFAAITAAQAFDHMCQADSLLKMNEADTPRANIYGNTQMLAYRIGWFMHDRRPNDTAADAAKRLQEIQKLIAGKVELSLKADGCKGEAAKDAKLAYDLYTAKEPVIVDRMIDEEVVKNGGDLVMKKVPVTDEKEQKKIDKLKGANMEQLESMEAASQDEMPVDTPYRAYPAWGEWVKKELMKSPALPSE